MIKFRDAEGDDTTLTVLLSGAPGGKKYIQFSAEDGLVCLDETQARYLMEQIGLHLPSLAPPAPSIQGEL